VSLIDEALKRAQQAADRDAPRARPWVPAPLPDAGLARRRWVIRATLAGLAAGLGLAGVAALLIWAARPSPAAASRSGATAARPEAAVPVPTEVREADGGGRSGAPPARAAAAIAPARTPTPARSGSPGTRTMAEVQFDLTPVHVAAAPRLAETMRSASASGSPEVRAAAPPSGGKTYHGRIALPDGGSLELGGIVWSDADPRALVNDRVVGVGAYVQGYTVERIEEDRVVLEKDGKRVTISVK